MDPTIQKALHDKLYDRRKGGALEIEKLIRDDLAANNHDRIAKVVTALCNDYTYDVHHPYARTGGLIGLAAASIALGSEVPRYLKQIVPPVLACFADQDARVRYYACESMYNIAKTSKGEILPYFNDVFDALAKLAADSEMSVKNGAELLDRLIKDIISESATSYVSVLHDFDTTIDDENAPKMDETSVHTPTAFSLPRFIPLLQERILVMNPFTRTFLVSWITLLDSIPDLELVSYLPSFLGGLFRFLSDSNQDVVTATQHVLERFLDEIKLVATVKRGLAENRKEKNEDVTGQSVADNKSVRSVEEPKNMHDDNEEATHVDEDPDETGIDSAVASDSEDSSSNGQEDWIPGQDVHVDHPKILDILLTFLKDASEEHIQLTALRWIDSFFDICPEDILFFVPRLLNQVLPALSSDIDQVRLAGNRVNNSLMEYIMSLSDEESNQKVEDSRTNQSPSPPPMTLTARAINGIERRESVQAGRAQKPQEDKPQTASTPRERSPDIIEPQASPAQLAKSLDYEASVNALTLQFLNENEATRVAALSWLLMLQRRAPRMVLAAHDGTFPALLKTLSDPSDTVVTRDLQLLSQISKNSDDSYFTFFMVNLLKLFCTDRRLLENRGNLIVRQLCVNLSPERIYRTMADCLEKDEDLEFTSIMVQNLNNNLITAPELADLRKKLRNWELRDGQTLFVTLFRSWCHNAVATISLCLLAQAYEQAYNLLQIFADIEMTVNMLIQIDKLVQLLESPVFTYLRLQLLEPDRHPYLYKCLYGILMLLPQSAAFAALKNRLNSVSAIGYLHIPHPTTSSISSSTTTPSSSLRGQVAGATPGVVSVAVPAFERANRLKSREDAAGAASGPPLVKWSELLEKFKSTQDRARRASRAHLGGGEEGGGAVGGTVGGGLGGGPGPAMQLPLQGAGRGGRDLRLLAAPDGGRGSQRPVSEGEGSVGGAGGSGAGGAGGGLGRGSAVGFLGQGQGGGGAGWVGGLGAGTAGVGGQGSGPGGLAGKDGHRNKFSATNLGRFAGGVRGKGGKK